MKIARIEWTELSRHSASVLVPDDFNPDEYDLENALANLDDDGFEGLERENIEVYYPKYPPTQGIDNEEFETLQLEGYEQS